MDKEFQGKRALVTGAASGIGKGIAVELSNRGAQVVALDVTEEGLAQLKTTIPTAQTVQVDLSDWAATKSAIRSVFPVDLLVNNAGIGAIMKLQDVTEKDYDQIFAVNTKAVVNVTQTVIENMLQRNVPGSIVNISSQASKAALPNHTLYCATKAAVDGFTRAVALDFGPNGIRINTVNPTVVLTDLGRRFWSDPALSGPMKAKIPIGRFAEVHEVVEAVLFLLSDKASMITGANLPVDGGYLAC